MQGWKSNYRYITNTSQAWPDPGSDHAWLNSSPRLFSYPCIRGRGVPSKLEAFQCGTYTFRYGPKNHVESFRPIFLLSVASKVLEKHVYYWNILTIFPIWFLTQLLYHSTNPLCVSCWYFSCWYFLLEKNKSVACISLIYVKLLIAYLIKPYLTNSWVWSSRNPSEMAWELSLQL